jgi:hypothetical protein
VVGATIAEAAIADLTVWTIGRIVLERISTCASICMRLQIPNLEGVL